ncbi:enoyl-CoA hydratase/isomerase family protein [Membranihabitans marinus]|uniref:enoyl-CoA hydratase/isomerase family protein n=1 Tax=Membranihabitans marinus TaxID=1227546 RepID=UPI001F0223DD|nr:enoyl-CoA hydratase-related protein [Membranihabitans marinus]
MEFQNLKVTTQDQIVVLTISRPQQLNALNNVTMNELEQFVNSIALDKQIKGLVITGDGNKAFVAGADIKEFTELDVKGAESMAERGQKIFQSIEDLPFPVVAAINGFALGGGLELALACHIRVAGSTVQMGLPEVKLGIIPGYGGTQRLTKIIGRAKAIEFIASGEMIEARKAKEMGLISHVTILGNELLKSIELIHSITKYSPNTMSKILKATAIAGSKNGYQYEREAFGELFNTQDAKEGIQAFIEKRKPSFKGF